MDGREHPRRRRRHPPLPAQVEQAYLNITTALAAARGPFDDVATMTAYVVDWTPDKMPSLMAGLTADGLLPA